MYIDGSYVLFESNLPRYGVFYTKAVINKSVLKRFSCRHKVCESYLLKSFNSSLCYFCQLLLIPPCFTSTCGTYFHALCPLEKSVNHPLITCVTVWLFTFWCFCSSGLYLISLISWHDGLGGAAATAWFKGAAAAARFRASVLLPSPRSSPHMTTVRRLMVVIGAKTSLTAGY
jgi:hypothetical protein